jgi:hypothetical protein
VYPSHLPSMFVQRFQIAQRLSAFESSKGIGSTRDQDILDILRGQLQEYARVWTTLVELARRMQEVGTLSQGCWYVQMILQHNTHFLKQLVVGWVFTYISHQRQIIPGASLIQKLF